MNEVIVNHKKSTIYMAKNFNFNFEVLTFYFFPSCIYLFHIQDGKFQDHIMKMLAVFKEYGYKMLIAVEVGVCNIDCGRSCGMQY